MFWIFCIHTLGYHSFIHSYTALGNSALLYLLRPESNPFFFIPLGEGPWWVKRHHTCTRITYIIPFDSLCPVLKSPDFLHPSLFVSLKHFCSIRCLFPATLLVWETLKNYSSRSQMWSVIIVFTVYKLIIINF